MKKSNLAEVIEYVKSSPKIRIDNANAFWDQMG